MQEAMNLIEMDMDHCTHTSSVPQQRLAPRRHSGSGPSPLQEVCCLRLWSSIFRLVRRDLPWVSEYHEQKQGELAVHW